MDAASAPHTRWPWPPMIKASVGVHAAAGGAALLLPEGASAWALASVALNHVGLSAAGLWPRSRLLGPNVTRLPGARPEVAITIDDGPDPETTPQVLELLARENAVATFFCIASRVRAQPALARAIVAAGHSIQNHSDSHRHDFSLCGPRTLRHEIARAQDTLSDATGQRPHCFRAPAGLRSPLLDPQLHALGLHLVSWTRRGYDTRSGDAGRVLARLTRDLAGGDILLLHDGHARRGANGRAVLLDVLPPLLQRCRGAGLTPVTLRQALPPRHQR